jgi:hypothetical protein
MLDVNQINRALRMLREDRYRFSEVAEVLEVSVEELKEAFAE